jgi:hypothetical protein
MVLPSKAMDTTRRPPDVSIAPRLVVTTTLTLLLALSLFTTRIYIRKLNHRLGKEDYALIAGVVCNLLSIARLLSLRTRI